MPQYQTKTLKLSKKFSFLAVILLSGCETPVPDPAIWQAWDNSCHFIQNKKIDRMPVKTDEYAITEKDQEVDYHTGKVFYESIYRGVCVYNKDDSEYHCNWQAGNLKDQYEYQITAKTLYENWSDHLRDKNSSVVHAYAIYDHQDGALLASSAASKISESQAHNKYCGEILKAEDVFQPAFKKKE